MAGLVGVTLDTHTEMLPGSDVIAIVRKHEAWGYESQWLSDALGREPFPLAAMLLAHTSRLKVGTAVANMYGRDEMTAAQMRNTLNEFSGGRFLLGLGVSNAGINAIRHAEWVQPVPKLREYLGRMAADPSTSAKFEGPQPVYIAAHAPGAQKVAREMADGIMTWAMPPEHIKLSRERIGPDKEINAQMVCSFAEDPAVARETIRKYIPTWLQIPSYRAAWVSAGFEEADFAEGGSDRLIDAIAGWGSPEKIARKIAEYHDAGATRVIVEPVRLVVGEKLHPLLGQLHVEGDFDQLERLGPLVNG